MDRKAPTADEVRAREAAAMATCERCKRVLASMESAPADGSVCWVDHCATNYPRSDRSAEIALCRDAEIATLKKQVARFTEAQFDQIEGKPGTCTYCRSVGACPRCWGRTGIDAANAEIATLRAEIAAHVEARGQLDGLRVRIGELNALLDEREQQIATLRARVEELEHVASALDESSRRVREVCGGVGSSIEQAVALRARAEAAEADAAAKGAAMASARESFDLAVANLPPMAARSVRGYFVGVDWSAAVARLDETQHG